MNYPGWRSFGLLLLLSPVTFPQVDLLLVPISSQTSKIKIGCAAGNLLSSSLGTSPGVQNLHPSDVPLYVPDVPPHVTLSVLLPHSAQTSGKTVGILLLVATRDSTMFGIFFSAPQHPGHNPHPMVNKQALIQALLRCLSPEC